VSAKAQRDNTRRLPPDGGTNFPRRCIWCVKIGVAVAAFCLLVALSGVAQAKEGAVARLHAPVPMGAQPGSAITLAWSLVLPEINDQPLNACGVFVQLRSATGAIPTRGYADGGACRAHLKGEYEATLIVPEGGISAVEVGLSGTTDIYFQVVPSTIPASSPLAPRTESFSSLAIIGTVTAIAGAALLIGKRRGVFSTAH